MNVFLFSLYWIQSNVANFRVQVDQIWDASLYEVSAAVSVWSHSEDRHGYTVSTEPLRGFFFSCIVSDSDWTAGWRVMLSHSLSWIQWVAFDSEQLKPSLIFSEQHCISSTSSNPSNSSQIPARSLFLSAHYRNPGLHCALLHPWCWRTSLPSECLLTGGHSPPCSSLQGGGQTTPALFLFELQVSIFEAVYILGCFNKPVWILLNTSCWHVCLLVIKSSQG